MARDLSAQTGIDNTDADYINGKLVNGSTPVSEGIYQDVVQFFQGLMDKAGLTASGLSDNETNTYQFIEALETVARSYKATSSNQGTLEITTLTEAQSGTDTDKIMTPFHVKSTKIVDRGDPVSADFSLTDFISDGSWHNLDLSSIVPTWATTTCLRVIMQPSDVAATDSGILLLREDGNVNEVNSSVVTARNDVAGGGVGSVASDCWVKMSAAREIEYNLQEVNNGLTVLNITVAFWM